MCECVSRAMLQHVALEASAFEVGMGRLILKSVLIQRQIPGPAQGRLLCQSSLEGRPAACMQAVCRLAVRVF